MWGFACLFDKKKCFRNTQFPLLIFTQFDQSWLTGDRGITGDRCIHKSYFPKDTQLNSTQEKERRNYSFA